MINVELFKTEWDKINDKLKEIDAIPKLDGGGDDFTGIESGMMKSVIKQRLITPVVAQIIIHLLLSFLN